MKLEQTLTYTRSTKNTHRYDCAEADKGKGPDQVYLQKSATGPVWPQAIRVTIEEVK